MRPTEKRALQRFGVALFGVFLSAFLFFNTSAFADTATQDTTIEDLAKDLAELAERMQDEMIKNFEAELKASTLQDRINILKEIEEAKDALDAQYKAQLDYLNTLQRMTEDYNKNNP